MPSNELSDYEHRTLASMIDRVGASAVLVAIGARIVQGPGSHLPDDVRGELANQCAELAADCEEYGI
jgi:hypothetical protein